MKKFSADVQSNSSTLSSSEYTLHTSDFESTGSETFQASWKPKPRDQEEEEEVWEEVVEKENKEEKFEQEEVVLSTMSHHSNCSMGSNKLVNDAEILPTEENSHIRDEEFLSTNGEVDPLTTCSADEIEISSTSGHGETVTASVAESNTPVADNQFESVDVVSSSSSSSMSSTVLPSIRLCDTRDQPFAASVKFVSTQRSHSCLPLMRQSILPLDLSMSKYESYQFGSVVSAAESTSIPNSETSPIGSISSSELCNSKEE